MKSISSFDKFEEEVEGIVRPWDNSSIEFDVSTVLSHLTL